MRRVILAALLGLAACSSSSTDANKDGVADGTYKPNDITLVAPSTPVGNVSGLVLDADGAPIAGATVTLSNDPQPTTTTDSAGHFAFNGQPAGSSVGVSISKSGYTSAALQAYIPGSAGNVPIDNATAFVGPVRLFATTGTLNVSVVGFDGQAVSPTAIVQISPAYVVESNGNFSNGGWTVAKATGSNGLISFTGIPDLAELARLTTSASMISIAVDPIDANSDGTPEYGGATLQISVASALASPGSLSIVLPEPSQGQGALQIVGSTCGTLVSTGSGGGGPAGSQVNPSDSISVAFNQPISHNSFSVQVLDDDGTTLGVNPDLNGSNTILGIAGTSVFPAGHALTVKVTATAASSRPASSVTFTGTCFVAPGGAAPVVHKATYTGAAGASLTPGSVVSVEFESTMGNEAASPQFSAYFDVDLDGDGKRRSVGEYDPQGNNPSPGFPVTVDFSKQTALGGHFSRFYTFTYSGFLTNVQPNRGVFFYFNDARTSGDTTLEWVNGAALSNSGPPEGFITPVQ